MTHEVASASHFFSFPAELEARAAHFAELEGVPLEQWIREALAAKVESAEIFDRRAAGATTRPLGELLDRAPNRPPDPGDEFEQ